jgi:hypothetical protein
MCLGQSIGKVPGFVDRVAARRGYEHEGGARVGEQLLDSSRSLPETLLHPVERPEEGDGVLDDFRASNF